MYIYIYTHTCVYTYTYRYTFVCLLIYILVYTCVCIYVHPPEKEQLWKVQVGTKPQHLQTNSTQDPEACKHTWIQSRSLATRTGREVQEVPRRTIKTSCPTDRDLPSYSATKSCPCTDWTDRLTGRTNKKGPNQAVEMGVVPNLNQEPLAVDVACAWTFQCSSCGFGQDCWRRIPNRNSTTAEGSGTFYLDVGLGALLPKHSRFRRPA